MLDGVWQLIGQLHSCNGARCFWMTRTEIMAACPCLVTWFFPEFIGEDRLNSIRAGKDSEFHSFVDKVKGETKE